MASLLLVRRSDVRTVLSAQRNHGVLILSEFVGAAQTLGSGALLVNPCNTDEVAKALPENVAKAAEVKAREEFTALRNTLQLQIPDKCKL